MKKAATLIVCALSLFGTAVSAQQNILNYIKVYSNQAVDNTFSLKNGPKATYVHNAIMDTIAAYINRSKYSVDIAQYDYSAYSADTMSHIATAINNAYKRGVKIRWIYDGSQTNAGLSLLSASVHTEASPTGAGYGIMHNKFVVIDEYTSNAIVSTGSEDWSITMNDHDYNNLLFIQSGTLAKAYTNEFNIMWGDTTHGSAANAAKAKFGTNKPNSGTHTFTIGGSTVNLYFSPSDGTNTQVINTINSASTDMYCGMYEYTQTQYSSPFVSKANGGVYSAAIIDQFSVGNNAYTAMSGITNFAEYKGSYIYHNKYLIVDPANTCSDPVVLTGSMNWSAAGYDENDENVIIIHNDTIANLYLQAFAKDYEVIGKKTLSKQKGCPLSTDNITDNEAHVNVYPNPFNGNTTISYTPSANETVTIEVYTIMGQKISTLAENKTLNAGRHTFMFNSPTAGVYILRIEENGHVYVKKLVSVN